MKTIQSVVKSHVSFSLKEALRRKINLVSKKASDLGSTIQKYNKILNDLGEDYEKLEKETQNLHKLFVKAAPSSSSIKKKLEDAITTFKESRIKRAKAESVVVQIKNDFGNNSLAKPLLKEAAKLVDSFKELEMEHEKLLSSLTKTHVPIQLTTHDLSFFRPLIAYIVQDLKKEKSDADILVKESKYIPGIITGKNAQIKWARYIPLVNIPTIFGEPKDIYLVITITYTAFGEEKGKIVPLMVEDKRGVEKPAVSSYSIGMTSKLIDPVDMSPILYKVSSLTEAKSVLSYLAQKNNLAVFGESIHGTVEQRMEKLKERFRILNDPDIVILKDSKSRNFFTIKVPEEKVDTDFRPDGKVNTKPTPWDRDLYMDASLFAGLPANAKTNYGRLNVVKVYKEKGYVCFLFRVLPVSVDFSTDSQDHKKNDEAGVIPEFDSSTPEGPVGNLNKDIAELRRQANKWLSM